MLEQFLNHLDSIGPVRRSHKFLLAVSGGMDSMVMFDLFSRAGLSIAVAHCNFWLRPEEAASEEELVRNICSGRNVPVYVEHFNTTEYANTNNLSTQLAARQLRYAFFHRILAENNLDWVVTAHHLNDSLETTLLNLVRGTGLEGLTGIPRINDRTIRPLLFASRREIEEYASLHNVQFLQDSSNLSDDYMRNLLRNKVIPVLQKVNPGLEQTFRSTSARLDESYRILTGKIQQIESEAITYDGDRILILKKPLLESNTSQLLLWELLKRFGFTYDQCARILSTTQPGKQFSSDTFDLINDRNHYMLRARTERAANQCMVHAHTSLATMNGEVLELEERPLSDVEIQKNDSTAFLDSDKIVYPLCWRYWTKGDSFQPLGMSNHKKLSDFFIDRKIDRLSKDRISVLESNGKIIWVVGQRISEDAKVSDKTERVTIFRWSGYPSAEG